MQRQGLVLAEEGRAQRQGIPQEVLGMKIYQQEGKEYTEVECTGCGSHDSFSINPEDVSCACGEVLQ